LKEIVFFNDIIVFAWVELILNLNLPFTDYNSDKV
jgi:hypothetical protein